MTCEIKTGGKPVIVKAVVIKKDPPTLSGTGVPAPTITSVPRPSG